MAELVVTYSDSKDPVLTGEAYSYTIIVTNRGPRDALNVTLGVSRPTPVAFTAAITLFGSCQITVAGVNCDFGAIPSGESRTVTIGASGAQVGTFASGLAVHGFVGSPSGLLTTVPTGQTAVESTTFVAPSADLRVTISDAVDPILLGTGQIEYTVIVSNTGPQPATMAMFEGLVAGPAGADSAVPTQGTCTALSATVRCPLGTIPAGGSATITVRSLPTSAGKVTLSGFATANELDPDTSNNSTHQETMVAAGIPTMGLTMQVALASVGSGQDPGFVAAASNTGTAAATNVTLQLSLTGGGVFTSIAPPPNWSCQLATALINCQSPLMPIGTTAVFAPVVSAPSQTTATQVEFMARLMEGSSGTDLVRLVSSTVTPEPNIFVTSKVGPAAPVELLPGVTVTYTLTVENRGTAAATSFSVRDDFPPSFVFVSATAPCSSPASSTIICNFGALPVGGSTTFDVTFRPTSVGTFTNSAYQVLTMPAQGGGQAFSSAVQAITTVVALPVTALAISPASPVLQANQTQAFTLLGTLANGAVVDLTQVANWSSSATAQVAVDDTFGAKGQAVAIAPGTATITATIPGTTLSASTTVRVNHAPVAAFASGCPDLGCHFDGTASADADGNITNYRWDYGDGRIESGTSVLPFHIYNSPGTYTVTLTVTDNDGGVTSVSHPVTVTASATADLSAAVDSVSESPYHPLANIALRIALRFTNAGPDAVLTTQMEVLVVGAVILNHDLSLPGASCSITAAGGSLRCTLASPFLPGPISFNIFLEPPSVTGASVDTVISVLHSGLELVAANNTASASVPVSHSAPASLVVTPANPSVNAGQNIALAARLNFADGTSLDVTQSASWSSSLPNFASVSNVPGSRGQVTAVAAGSSVITAAFVDAMGTVWTAATTVTVAPPPGASSATVRVTRSAGPSPYAFIDPVIHDPAAGTLIAPAQAPADVPFSGVQPGPIAGDDTLLAVADQGDNTQANTSTVTFFTRNSSGDWVENGVVPLDGNLVRDIAFGPGKSLLFVSYSVIVPAQPGNPGGVEERVSVIDVATRTLRAHIAPPGFTATRLLANPDASLAFLYGISQSGSSSPDGFRLWAYTLAGSLAEVPTGFGGSFSQPNDFAIANQILYVATNLGKQHAVRLASGVPSGALTTLDLTGGSGAFGLFGEAVFRDANRTCTYSVGGAGELLAFEVNEATLAFSSPQTYPPAASEMFFIPALHPTEPFVYAVGTGPFQLPPGVPPPPFPLPPATMVAVFRIDALGCGLTRTSLTTSLPGPPGVFDVLVAPR